MTTGTESTGVAQPSTQAVPVATRLAVLKHLSAGRSLEFVAQACKLSPNRVKSIAKDNGYPDPKKMAWAVDLLHDELSPPLPDRTPRRPVVRRPAAAPRPPALVRQDAGTGSGSGPYVTALACSKLFADPAYQRELDDARVQRMAKAYDPALVGVLEVSARDDGRFALVDGQHRWAMLRLAHPGRDRAPVVCNVHTGLTPESEARLFYEIDAKRRRLTGFDRWNARRGAGDPKVLDIERVAAGHGLEVTPVVGEAKLRVRIDVREGRRPRWPDPARRHAVGGGRCLRHERRWPGS